MRMSDYKDSVAVTRLINPQYDHYRIDLYVPLCDLHELRSTEEFHGYLIPKIEALMYKDESNDK
jgi:hypothetical protein